MKKLLACLLIACLISTTFAACTANVQNDSKRQSSVNNQIVGDNSVDKTSGDTPNSAVFFSLEEIKDLKSMLNKSDEEVEEYFAEKATRIQGMHSKKDIERVFLEIGDLPLLHLKEESGYKFDNMLYSITYKYVEMLYVDNDDAIIRLVHYLPNSELLSKSNSQEANEKEHFTIAKEKLKISNEKVELKIGQDDETAYRIFGVFDNRVTIILLDKAQKGFDMEAIEQNIIETTLNELIEQKLK